MIPKCSYLKCGLRKNSLKMNKAYNVGRNMYDWGVQKSREIPPAWKGAGTCRECAVDWGRSCSGKVAKIVEASNCCADLF